MSFSSTALSASSLQHSMNPPRIFSGPPLDSTTSSVFTEEILRADTPRKARILYLTPSSRKRHQILRFLGSNNCGFQPSVMTFGTLAMELYELLGGPKQPLAPSAQNCLLHHMFTQLENQFPTGFTAELARHILEVRNYGISAETLFSISESEDERCRILAVATDQYETLLEENNWTDQPGLLMFINETLAFSNRQLRWCHLFIDGFLDFTPLQLETLKILSHRMDLTLFWPGDTERPDIYQPALSQLKLTFPSAAWHSHQNPNPRNPSLHHLAATMFSPAPSSAPMPSPGSLRTFAATDPKAEVEKIAQDIKHRFLNHSNTPDFPLDQVCVTFTDLQTYAPYIRWLFPRYGIPFNLSQELPLSHSAMASTLRTIIKTAKGFRRNDLLQLARDPFLTLPFRGDRHTVLRGLDHWSRQLKILRGSVAWQEKYNAILPQNPPLKQAAAEELRMLVDGIQALAAILEPLSTPSSFKEFLLRVRKAADQLKLPQNLLHLADLYSRNPDVQLEQNVRAYGAFLKLWEGIDPVLDGISGDSERPVDACEDFFFSLISGESYQVMENDTGCVQVLGLLETRGLSFDHIYLGGLIDETFPADKKSSIFFWNPELYDELLGLEHRRPIYRAQTDLIRMLWTPRKTMTLCWPGAVGDSETIPSFLLFNLAAAISGLTLERFFQVESVRIAEMGISGFLQHHLDSTEPLDSRLSANPQCLSVPGMMNFMGEKLKRSLGKTESAGGKALFLSKKALLGLRSQVERLSGKAEFSGRIINADLLDRLNALFGGERVLPVTLFDRYMQCPARFFYEAVCGLVPGDEPVEELAPPEAGSFIHEVLHRFMAVRLKEGKGRVGPGEIPVEFERLTALATSVFQARGETSMFALRELDLFCGPEGVPEESLAMTFLQAEAAVETDFSPYLLEWKFVPVVLESAGKEPVRYRGKIDRIDRTDGTAVVFDYKTGRVPDGKSIDDMAVLQVGLYLLAVRTLLPELPAGGFYYQVSHTHGCKVAAGAADAGVSEIEPFFASRSQRKPMDSPSFQNYLLTAQSAAMEIARRIRCGEFPATGAGQTCRSCAYQFLCRQKEFAGDDE